MPRSKQNKQMKSTNEQMSITLEDNNCQYAESMLLEVILYDVYVKSVIRCTFTTRANHYIIRCQHKIKSMNQHKRITCLKYKAGIHTANNCTKPENNVDYYKTMHFQNIIART
ncbi:hypothetical protein V1478_005170 [Vespula squamosa]|uniref:Uncharacterized protein n=1 Tax=Vespula squamosa TaxID=30214 RepID=A0ABD2BDD8_VESSQ